MIVPVEEVIIARFEVPPVRLLSKFLYKIV